MKYKKSKMIFLRVLVMVKEQKILKTRRVLMKTYPLGSAKMLIN